MNTFNAQFDDFVLTSCIDTFLVVKSRYKFFRKSCSQIVENVNVYFFLRTNYSNYVTFDEALALLYWLKKRQ